ncbi:MAG TPA: hypothetical protein VFK82_09950 [Burkholderiaceae bacterium]|nr:hypothetical protein [Burkholderiaceae bacterium]
MRPALHAIEYTPVSADALREELRHLHAGNAPRWVQDRSPRHEVEDLLPETCRWFDRLPDYLSPEATAVEYPAIANRLAWLWPEPMAAMRYLDDLILDQGTGQRTFPMHVLFELVALKAWLDEMRSGPAGSAFGLPVTLRSAGRTWPGGYA